MHNRVRAIVVEEAWRSVVWFGISLIGWTHIITQTSRIQATAGTVLGLPVLTAFVAAALLVGVRLWTNHDVRLSADGTYLVWVGATVTGAFAALYYIFALGGTALVIPALIGGALAGLWLIQHEFLGAGSSIQ